MELIEARLSPDSTTFSFWVPVAKSLRRTEDEAEATRWVQGLTAAQNRDQQGEYLHMTGMDFAPLLKSGYINWNHERGPENLIGTPTEGDLRETDNGYGLWMRGYLFDKPPRATAAWEMLDELEEKRKRGLPTRQIGWSVEGGISARDPHDKSQLTKSVVRHMAMTHEPVNAVTYAEMAKAMGQTLVGETVAFHPDRNTHLAFDSFGEFAKSMAAQVGAGSGSMGNMAPLMGGRATIDRVLESSRCKRCRKNYTRPRHRAMAHLTKCLGEPEDESFRLVKALLHALD